jgi:hypothetical protein
VEGAVKLQKNNRSPQNGFGTVFVLAAFIFVASSAFLGFAHQAQSPAVPTDINLFVGTWSAVHSETPYFVLELHNENGTLAGGIRVCAFTMNGEGEHADITITNKNLAPSLPIRNLVLSGKSLSFDWKDPDGDENHLKFERTAENSGRLNWRDLPDGAKMSVIMLSKRPAQNP